VSRKAKFYQQLADQAAQMRNDEYRRGWNECMAEVMQYDKPWSDPGKGALRSGGQTYETGPRPTLTVPKHLPPPPVEGLTYVAGPMSNVGPPTWNYPKNVRPDLIPARAEIELAHHYSEGAEKYTEYGDDGRITHDGSNNWRLGYEWSKSIAALERHILAFKSGEDYDEPWPNGNPGSKHIIAAAWHCLALATFMDECPELDDRWKGPR
jgi:hypothetical protein